MMKLLLLLTWTITVYGNSCDPNVILCMGTVNNETGIDGSGCLSTESCRVTLTLSFDVESDKFVIRVDSRPGNLFSLIGLIQDEKIKQYFHFKPRNQTDMEVRMDQKMVPNLGVDLDEPFSIRLSAWIPTSTRIGAKTFMVEDVVVSFAGVENWKEMLEKRREKREEIEEVVEYEDVPAQSLADVDGPADGSIQADGPIEADDAASGDVIQEEPDGRVLMNDAGNMQREVTESINGVSDGANQATVTPAVKKGPNGSASVTISSILLSFAVLVSLVL